MQFANARRATFGIIFGHFTPVARVVNRIIFAVVFDDAVVAGALFEVVFRKQRLVDVVGGIF